MLSISTVQEALTYLSMETGRYWSESELFDIVSTLNLRLCASLPTGATSAIWHYTEDFGLVEKFRCHEPLLALLYPHDVARVWLSGECLARHVEDNRIADGELNLLSSPIPITRADIRIRLDILNKILSAWRDAQAGKNQHRVPAFARPRRQLAHVAKQAEPASQPAPANETPPAATPDALPASPTDNTLSELFDPVTIASLEKMFPANGQWSQWAERAARNGLKESREDRALFNPYRAALWFLQQGESGWNLARCNRVLANNLPARSRHEGSMLTGDLN